MEKSIEQLISESRERSLRIQEQEQEEKNEKLRSRNYQESKIKIEAWKKEHQKKRKTSVRISIVEDYVMQFDKRFYKLRLFVNNELVEIYNIDEDAGLILTSGLESNSLGGKEFYTIYSNI